MKKLIFAMLLTGTCLMTDGCSYYPLPNKAAFLPSETQTEPDGLRCPDGMRLLDRGDTIKSSCVNLKINSAGLYKTYEGDYPGDDDWRFLLINITAESQFQNTAVMYLEASQFFLTWDALEGNAVTPEEGTYISEQLPDYENKIRLFKNSVRSGNLVFVVPKEASGFRLIYQQSALPFTAQECKDPYDSYYSNSDPFYDSPFYDSPYFNWFDFFNHSDEEHEDDRHSSDSSHL